MDGPALRNVSSAVFTSHANTLLWCGTERVYELLCMKETISLMETHTRADRTMMLEIDTHTQTLTVLDEFTLINYKRAPKRKEVQEQDLLKLAFFLKS